MRIPSDQEDTETRLRRIHRRFCSPSRKFDRLISPCRSRSRSNTPPYSSGYRRGTSPLISSRPSYSSYDRLISSSPTNTPPYSSELNCGRFSSRSASRSRGTTPPCSTQLRTLAPPFHPNYILNHHQDSPAQPSPFQRPPSVAELQQQVVSNVGRVSPDRSVSRSPMRSSENDSDSSSSDWWSSDSSSSEEEESEDSEREEEERRWRRSKLKVKVRGGKKGPIVSYGKRGSMVNIRGGRDGPIVTYQQPFYRP